MSRMEDILTSMELRPRKKESESKKLQSQGDKTAGDGEDWYDHTFCITIDKIESRVIDGESSNQTMPSTSEEGSEVGSDYTESQGEKAIRGRDIF